ncbi:hypothetical protein B0H15DRAFT_948450 [Mycena belliarum]|uniref:Uncharacterized protein n=1 Tax=Mycena belliarum TaxID=1033014 RepID=A0AAD6U662_9AGAR|nr:hypothetical protein B0H15DRAFT_948450 [Mycena belliae]
MSTSNQPDNQPDRPRLPLDLGIVEYQLRGSRHLSFILFLVPTALMSPAQRQLVWLWNYTYMWPLRRRTEDAPETRLHLATTDSPLDPDNAL